MDARQITEAIQNVAGAKFASFTYTSKSSGETARWTLILGSDYDAQIQASITEVDIRLRDATGIERFALEEIRASLVATLEAHARGEENPAFTKAGQYLPLARGLKLNLRDCTLEVQGLKQSYTVLVAGEHKAVNHRNALTAAKAKLRKELPVGRWVTLALDAGNIHSARLNGETIEFE